MATKEQIKITNDDPNESNVTIPQFALERTQREMLKAIKQAIPKNVFKESKDELKKGFEKVTQQIIDGEDVLEDVLETFFTNSLKPMFVGIANQKQAEQDAESDGKVDALTTNFVKTALALTSLAKFSAVAFAEVTAALAGATYWAIQETGREFMQLAEVGVGLRGSLNESNTALTSTMNTLSRHGVDAADTMQNLSAVIVGDGLDSFEKLSDEFFKAAGAVSNHGLLLGELGERFAEEANVRHYFNTLDTQNSKAQAIALNESINRHRQHAKILGRASKDLQNFSIALIQNTDVLAATILSLPKDMKKGVIEGVQAFGSAMAAYGKEAEDLVATMTNAATKGALGLDEKMVEFVKAFPNILPHLNRYTEAIQNGTFGVNEASAMHESLTRQVENMTQAEKDRITQLAKIGHAESQVMSRFITQVERAAKIRDDDDDTYAPELKAFTHINDLISSFIGEFDALRRVFLSSFFAAIGGIKGFKDELSKMGDKIAGFMQKIFGLDSSNLEEMFGEDGALTKLIVKFGEFVGKYLPSMINVIIDAVGGFAVGLASVLKVFGALFYGIGLIIYKAGEIVGMVFKSIHGSLTRFYNFIETLSESSYIFLIIKKSIDLFSRALGQAGNLLSFVFGDNLVEAVGRLVGGLLGLIVGFKLLNFLTLGLTNKFLTWGTSKIWGGGAKAASGTAGSAASGWAGKAADKVKGVFGFGGKAADKAGSAVGKVADNADKAAKKGKKSGGFLRTIAKGIAAFGNPKVLLGVAAMAGIAGTLWILGKALQQFQGLDWKSFFIAGAALAALTAATLVMGAVAPMAILGAISMGIVSVALMGLGFATKMIAESLPAFTDAFTVMIDQIIRLKDFNPLQLMGLAYGITALGASLVALSGGSLLSSALNGLGSLFGAKSPFEKIKELGSAAPQITAMMNSLSSVGTAAEGVVQLAKSFAMLANEVNDINFDSLIRFGEVYSGTKESNVSFKEGKAVGLIEGVSPAVDAERPAPLQQISQKPTTDTVIEKTDGEIPKSMDTEKDLLMEILKEMKEFNRLSKRQRRELGEIANNI